MKLVAPQGRGKGLFDARESALLTRVQLAKKAGVAARTIYNIEMGAASRQHTKRKLLIALGVSWERRREIFPELWPLPGEEG